MAGLVLPDSARGTWLLCCVALCLSGTGSADVGVTQSPRHLIKGQGGEAVLKCRPISGHNRVSWYQQARGQSPQFLIQYYEKSESERGNIPDRFSAQQFSDYSSELNVSSLQLADSALYLCASSWVWGGPDYEQHFGAGTRLTVIDDLSKVNPPKVTVFEPSEAEIARTQKATLVCLATGFYPDHVELSWWVNGKKVQSGVSTDPQAYKEQPSQSDSRYRLSSRLRVSATFWHNPRNSFRCQVEFHGISGEDARSPEDSERVTQTVSAETRGKADCGFTAKSYQQGLLSATILYEILLGKATLYAVLVSALVLMAMVKRKDS